jgi:hypothetical protein
LSLTLVLTACTHTQDEDQSEEELYDEDGAESSENLLQDLPHPRKPTAFATRVLISISDLPPAGNLLACSEEITAISKQATSQEQLLKAQMAVSQMVTNNQSLYHFCYYNMMAELDQKLSVGGPVMTEMASTFFTSFRTLWILSRALDTSTGKSVYFDYLRKRYVQISKDYFGRDVEIYAPAFREGIPGNRLSPMMGKPAGAAPTN